MATALGVVWRDAEEQGIPETGCRGTLRRAGLENREEGRWRLEDRRKKKVRQVVKRREGNKKGSLLQTKPKPKELRHGPCARRPAHGALLPPVSRLRPGEEPGSTWG